MKSKHSKVSSTHNRPYARGGKVKAYANGGFVDSWEAVGGKNENMLTGLKGGMAAGRKRRDRRSDDEDMPDDAPRDPDYKGIY